MSLAYLVDTDWVIDHFHGIDLLIAVTCLRHDLKLCSNNRRHFEMVEGLEILSVA